MSTKADRVQNNFGADLWVRESDHQRRHATAGRGLFAGLQDVKSYDVDNGWAKRRSSEGQSGLMGFLYARVFGGNYRPPTDH